LEKFAKRSIGSRFT